MGEPLPALIGTPAATCAWPRGAQHAAGTRRERPDALLDLELAKNAHNLFIREDPREQARLQKVLASNSTFDRGGLLVS